MTAALTQTLVSYMLEWLLAILALIPGGQTICFALLDHIAADTYSKAIASGTSRPAFRPIPCHHVIASTATNLSKNQSTIAIIIPLLANQIPSLADLSLTLSCLDRCRQLLSDATIIVVDDGSYYHRDVMQIAHRYGCLVLQNAVNCGAGQARNLGLDFVTKYMPSVERICFTDAGVEVTSEWCFALRDLGSDPNLIHTGPVLTSGNNIFDQYYATRGTLSPRYVESDCTNILYTPSCCMIWTRAVADLLRFNPEFASAAHEDRGAMHSGQTRIWNPGRC